MDFRPYSPRSPEELRVLGQKYGNLEVVTQLGEKDLKMPASGWKIQHLIAYRLLVRPERPTLPIFDHRHCLLCDKDRPETERARLINIQKSKALLIDTPPNIAHKNAAELIEMEAGYFWAALARALRSEDTASVGKVHPQRVRKPTELPPGHVTWEDAKKDAEMPSSSPTGSAPSESSHQPSLGDLSEEDNEVWRSKSEQATVHLVSAFFQWAVDLVVQQDRTYRQVCFRVEPVTSVALVAGKDNVRIVAEDDGGFCLMVRTELGWKTANYHLALLEAKRSFKNVYADEGKVSFVVSDENLAQCLGEAVIAWRGNADLRGNQGVFLFAATNAQVRLVYFQFGQNYLEYLEASDEHEQLRLIHDKTMDTFAHMHSTKWFDISKEDGRRAVLCQVLALVQWYTATHGSDDDGSNDDMEDWG